MEVFATAENGIIAGLIYAALMILVLLAMIAFCFYLLYLEAEKDRKQIEREQARIKTPISQDTPFKL